jgi:nucleoid DNA-binding protein
MDGLRLKEMLRDGPPSRYLYVPRIGWLTVLHFKAYVGRNPRTGEAVDVPAKRQIVFVEGYETEDGSTKALARALRNQQDRAVEDDASVVEIEPEDARTIREGLSANATFEIDGLGTFTRRKKKDRKTGEEHDIVVFKPTDADLK